VKDARALAYVYDRESGADIARVLTTRPNIAKLPSLLMRI